MASLKRLYTAVSRRTIRVMPVVLVATQETLKLAQAAQIPLCAPAFNIALEILNIFQAVKDAASATNELLQTIHVYNETVGHMVEILSSDYLENSEEVQARIARSSIAEFEKAMSSVKTTLDNAMAQRTWKRAINNSQIKADIGDCTRRLVAAREKFNSSTMMVILANTRSEQPRTAIDEFRIPGATPLRPMDIKLGSVVKHYGTLNNTHETTFWTDTRIAMVRGEKKLVKLYTQKDGGEEAFLRDMRSLGQNLWPNLPAILGYCRKASVPFIAFETSGVQRFGRFIKMLVLREPDTAVPKVWRMLVNLRDAAAFIVRNEPGIDARLIEDAVREPSVDENGEIILAPLPEVEGEFKDFKWSVEGLDPNDLIFGYWTSECLDGSARPLRTLGFALSGETEATLDAEIFSMDELPDILHNLWPTPANRALRWFIHHPDPLAPGDIGKFVIQEDGNWTFCRLGSVADDLGGVKMAFQEDVACDYKCVAENTVRFSFDPFEEGDSHNAVLKYGFRTSWTNTLHEKEATWEFLLANAQNLAERYGTTPEELVLITETSGDIESEPFEDFDESLTRPIYYYLHFSHKGHIIEAYWSFEDTPGSIICEEHFEELGLPGVESLIHSIPEYYLQLEKQDLCH